MRRSRLWLGGVMLALGLTGCDTGHQTVGIDVTSAIRLYREHADRRPTREQMQQVIAQLPAEQLNDLGVMHEREGRLEEAAWAYQQAIWKSPRFSLPYVNLGNVLRRQGKTEEARLRYRQALSADPGNFAAANNLGDLCASERVGREEAIARLAPLAAQAGPQRSYGMDTLGWLYYRRGEAEQAYTTLTAALQEADPTDAALLRSVHTHLAEVCRARGQEAEAAQHEAEAARQTDSTGK